MDIVLHRLSVVGGDCCGGERVRGQEILLEAQGYYNAMYRFRKDWERNKRYNYDNQWGDVVCGGVSLSAVSGALRG